MKFAIPLSALALALCAGCAQTGESQSTALGAGPAPTAKVYCRDGAWVSSSSACGVHGGVEREISVDQK